MNNMKEIQRINEREIDLGVEASEKSWHKQYSESAYVFVGGLDYDLTEGDLLQVFSQYGEIININLVRDKKTGKSKGFCFIAYEDQRSTIVAVDNFNGTKLCGRPIRVDHVKEYRRPQDEKGNEVVEEGCAPKTPSPSPPPSPSQLQEITKKPKKKKKEKKEKKEKRKKKKLTKAALSSEDSDRDSDNSPARERRKETEYQRRSRSRDRNRSGSVERVKSRSDCDEKSQNWRAEQRDTFHRRGDSRERRRPRSTSRERRPERRSRKRDSSSERRSRSRSRERRQDRRGAGRSRSRSRERRSHGSSRHRSKERTGGRYHRDSRSRSRSRGR